jgi:hypothetical protein
LILESLGVEWARFRDGESGPCGERESEGIVWAMIRKKIGTQVESITCCQGSQEQVPISPRSIWLECGVWERVSDRSRPFDWSRRM